MKAIFNYQNGIELLRVEAPLSKANYFTVFNHHNYWANAIANFCVICNHSLKTHIEYGVSL